MRRGRGVRRWEGMGWDGMGGNAMNVLIWEPPTHDNRWYE